MIILSKKAFSFAWTKLIGLVFILIVLLIIFPQFDILSDTTSEGISDFKMKAIIQGCELGECDIKSCVDESECNEFELAGWESYIKYLEKCDVATKEEREKLVCNKLYKKIDELSSKSTDSGFNQFSFSVDFKELDLKSCQFNSKTFSADSLSNTPYWVSIFGETGQGNFNNKLDQIVLDDTGNTHSYGHFGLNGETAQQFWDINKDLGLKGVPNSVEADESWKDISSSMSEELILAEIKWYNSYVIAPVIKYLKERGKDESVYSDPRIVAYLSDVAIQEGPPLMRSLVNKVEEPGIFSRLIGDSYLEKLAEYQGSDVYLKKRFRTYLKEHPDALDGLKNRVKTRLKKSNEVTVLRVVENGFTSCSIS